MKSVEQLCEQLGAADQAEAFQARQALWDAVTKAGAPDQEAQRAAVAKALAGKLGAVNVTKDEKSKPPKEVSTPALSAPVRRQVALFLGLVAGDEEVPVLRKALDDFDVRDSARAALERLTCQAATDALTEVAGGSSGTEFRVGLMAALGRKSGSGAVAALKTALDDPDGAVRLAAAQSLARHADPAHDALIEAAGKSAGLRGLRLATRARLELAAHLAAAGQKDAARSILSAVAEGKYPSAQKQAARAALGALG